MENDFKYTVFHSRLYSEGDLFVIGASDYVIQKLGKIIKIKLPEPGAQFKKGEIFGWLESDSAATEMYMPLAATVVSVNSQLVESPDFTDLKKYDNIWLMKVKSTTYDEDKVDFYTEEEYNKLYKFV